MIQEEYKDLVFKFAKQASLDGVANIFLFGSVAEGDADRRSDIDLLVVLDTRSNEFEESKPKTRISEIALDLEKEFDRDIQVIFTNKNFKGLDNYFISEVLKKGILLYSKSSSINIDGLELKPYALIIYSLRNIEKKDKMKLKRLLYGHKTRKIIAEKIYESEKTGLLHKLQGSHIGAGVIVLPQKNAGTVEEELNKFNITFNKIDLWLTEDGEKRLKL